MKDNREILKTILTTDLSTGTNGGLLLGEQMDKFIDLTLDYSKMLKMVRVERKNQKSGELDTLNIGSVVSEGADEVPDDPIHANEEVKPTFTKIAYATSKIRSIFDVSTTTLLDNIEAERRLSPQNGNQPSGDFRDTLMKSYAKRIASDQELLAIQGNTALSATSKTNRLLRANMGWDQLTRSGTGTHLVDADGTCVSFALFSAMIESLPAPYLNQINDLRWFVGLRTNVKWSQTVAARNTQLGDAAMTGKDVDPYGIPIVLVPLLPETMTEINGTSVETAFSFIWLTFPSNFIYCVRRNIESYWEFKPRRDRWENTTYSEIDMCVENPDAVVKAYDVKVDSAVAYS